jgi:hypothetical protein
VTEVFTEWGLADEVERALAVMACESLGDPFIVNASSGVTGLFQHRPVYWEDRTTKAGIPGANILDPWANTWVAAYLVRRSTDDPHPNGPWGHFYCGHVLGYW